MSYDVRTVHDRDADGNPRLVREVRSTDATGEEHVYRFEENDDGTRTHLGDDDAPSEVRDALTKAFDGEGGE